MKLNIEPIITLIYIYIEFFLKQILIGCYSVPKKSQLHFRYKECNYKYKERITFESGSEVIYT
jgi:hypothetical protein